MHTMSAGKVLEPISNLFEGDIDGTQLDNAKEVFCIAFPADPGDDEDQLVHLESHSKLGL